MSAACAVVRLSVSGWVSLLVTELATVTDRPSRIQAVPRPRTSRVWNGVQRSRSSRAGIVLRIGCCCGLAAVAVIAGPPPSAGRLAGPPGRPAAARYGRAGSRLLLRQRSCPSPSGYLTVPRPAEAHITQPDT